MKMDDTNLLELKFVNAEVYSPCIPRHYEHLTWTLLFFLYEWKFNVYSSFYNMLLHNWQSLCDVAVCVYNCACVCVPTQLWHWLVYSPTSTPPLSLRHHRRNELLRVCSYFTSLCIVRIIIFSNSDGVETAGTEINYVT